MLHTPLSPFALVLVTLLWCTEANADQATDDTYPPGTFQLTPWSKVQLQPVPVTIPDQLGHLPKNLSLNLPAGFAVRVFAAHDFNRPRFMAFDPAGVLHVADMNDKQILALPDRNEDGVADEAIVVASGFRRAHSLAFYKNDLYVGDRHEIVRFRDEDGDGIFENREVFADDIPSSGMHSTRTIVIDEKNEKIYLSVGWPCDMCELSESERGVVLEFNTDGSGRRVFASGVRNVVGMGLHPVTNQLWGTNNGHDREGIALPPEWVDIIRDGGFYGVPLAYGYQVFIDFAVPDYKEHLPLSRADSVRVASMKRPVALLPAHTAPMGIHFYNGELFPERYRNRAFVAMHAGHAKLAPSPGYKVVSLRTEPDGSGARFEDFVTGFQTGTEMNDVWGHPMGITADAQGRLYISSDLETHAIFRIEHSPIIATWTHSLPDTISSGTTVALEATVRLKRTDEAGEDPVVVANLGALGGAQDLPFEDIGDGVYILAMGIPVNVSGGSKTISVTVSQSTPTESHQVRLSQTVTVLPRSRPLDLPIFSENLADGWRVANKTWLENLNRNLAEKETVYSGERAVAFDVTDGDWDWVARFKPQQPLDLAGYHRLRVALNFSDLIPPKQIRSTFSLYVGNKLLDLVEMGLINMQQEGWQELDIPLAYFEVSTPIQQISFAGNFGGSFYLDELRLSTDRPNTAVVDAPGQTPSVLTLQQNYPNPFNSATVIRLTMPADGEMDLTLFNLAGQTVAKLLRGSRRAGVYEVHWDGTDESGRAVASGIYHGRLRFSNRGLGGPNNVEVRTRKLLLMR